MLQQMDHMEASCVYMSRLVGLINSKKQIQHFDGHFIGNSHANST
jgi:hypothetical protein